MVRLTVGVITVGMVVGYVVTSLIATVISDQGWFATSGESPQKWTVFQRIVGTPE